LFYSAQQPKESTPFEIARVLCVSITLPASDPGGPRFSFWARPSLFRATIFQKLRAKRREYDCAVIANRFDRATIHCFFAERFLLRGLWLLINVAITPVVVAFETGGGRFAAQIAVDALIIDVECSRCVFSVFVCDVRHSFYGKSEVSTLARNALGAIESKREQNRRRSPRID
jgi:hypothetical protein